MAVCDAILMASGDPRIGMLLSWMAGSTYQVKAVDALAVAAYLLPLMPLFARWLEILPLGEASSRSIGVGLTTSRFRLLLVTAVLTGAATLIVGPLSFIGLMAPHMARMTGLQRPMPQLYGAAVIGVLIMLPPTGSDATCSSPTKVPAGLPADHTS